MELPREKFNVKVGFIDHTLGVNSESSLDAEEFTGLVAKGKSTSENLRSSSWSVQRLENELSRLRNSLDVIKDV